MGKLIINNPLSVDIVPGRVTIECETGEISDGFHTFDDLYDHRCLLFLAFQDGYCSQALYGEPCDCTWKSRKHHDGSGFDGWFIAGMKLHAGQISYHIPDKYWDLCTAPEFETAPEWDGHTSVDVIERLRLDLIGSIQSRADALERYPLTG